jgi:hypothetical protein
MPCSEIMCSNDLPSRARGRELPNAKNARPECASEKRTDLPRTAGEWALAIALPVGAALLIVLAKLWVSR